MLNSIAAWIAVSCYLAFGWAPFRQALIRLSKRLGDLIIAPLLVPYLLAVDLRPNPGDLLRLSLYLAAPTLLLRLRSRRAKPLGIAQLLAVFAIWVPIELDLFTLLLDLIAPNLGLSARVASLQLLPSVRATLFAGFSVPITSVTAVLLALVLFLVRHPTPGIGMAFGLAPADARRALVGLAGFALVGIPVGLYTGFLHFNPSPKHAKDILLGLLGGYLFTALREELLFRGLIQNLLTRRIRRERIGLVIASVIFGLSHLNNGRAGFTAPNWTYALMATFAGLAYGWVWLQTRKATASAITHALVNGLWGTLFA